MATKLKPVDVVVVGVEKPFGSRCRNSSKRSRRAGGFSPLTG